MPTAKEIDDYQASIAKPGVKYRDVSGTVIGCAFVIFGLLIVITSIARSFGVVL